VSRRLIVTADDFGLDVAVNEAVERAARVGILTCASLMVTGPAAADAVERARRLPGLAVGLHLVLVDGTPALPAGEVSRLVGMDGRFRADPLRQGVRLFLSTRARREARAEMRAQLERFQASGLALDHVNSHHHFHLHPTVQRILLELAPRHGIRAVRVPWEPALPGVAPWRAGRLARLAAWIDALQARRLETRLRRASIKRNHRVYGLRLSGRMHAARVLDIVRELPEGASELYLHPVARPWRSGDPWPAHYQGLAELEALLDPEVGAALRERGALLSSFAEAAE